MSAATSQSVTCGICPRRCVLRPGEVGFCGVRHNVEGRLKLVAEDEICALSIDPVEKKPLYHVMPGAPVYSVACAGCTLRCLHCQNAGISWQGTAAVRGRRHGPADVVRDLRQHNCHWVAYTYTEPFAWLEYTLACCRAVREAGGRNMLITSGYASAASVRAVAPMVAAANVDLKAMSDRFYREICDGALAPVLRSIEILQEVGTHLEITNLLIPGKNDSDDEIGALVEWVRANPGPATPLHFSAFYPTNQMLDVPPTPSATLRRACEIARQAGMHHVYAGNIELTDGTDTCCHGCGTVLVRRRQYRVIENRVGEAGTCPECGTTVEGIWS